MCTEGSRHPAEILQAVAPTRSDARGWHVGGRVWLDGVVLATLERRLGELKYSRVVEVQSIYRMPKQRADFELARNSARKIQAAYRGKSSRRLAREDVPFVDMQSGSEPPPALPPPSAPHSVDDESSAEPIPPIMSLGLAHRQSIPAVQRDASRAQALQCLRGQPHLLGGPGDRRRDHSALAAVAALV